MSGAMQASRTWWAIVALAVALAAGPLSGTGHTMQDRGGIATADGLTAYLGVMPAPILRSHPPGHPEATMHGGVPRGATGQHLVVAVFDAITGARVSDAQVTATIEGLGHVGARTVRLEPMEVAGAMTYGGFVELPGDDRYLVRLEVRRPGAASPVTLNFGPEPRGR